MHQVSGVWARGDNGCVQCARGAGGRGVPNRARRLLTVHAEVLCISTHRSLLRRQLDVSGRPPSPPSRCHISTILWDLSSCLRSSSTRSLHQPSVSLNELSLNKLRGLNIALLGRVFLRPLCCLKIVLRNKINRQKSRYLKLTKKTNQSI